MLIRFSKSRHGPVLVCTREDGSLTGMKDRKHGPFFVRHDLMHYAVETVLDLRKAFYGMLAAGKTIESFNAPGISKTLSRDAVLAEYIVGMIDQSAMFSDKPLTAEQVNRDLQLSLADGGAGLAPVITQTQLDQIMQRFMNLYAQFQSLPEGGQLDLEYPTRHGEPVAISDGSGQSPDRGWPKAKMHGR